MGVFGILGNVFRDKDKERKESVVPVPKNPSAPPKSESYYGKYRVLFSTGYDGEKNLGEIGPAKEYWPEYEMLRIRSWQAYLESEIAQTVLRKYARWVVGAGLKLQAEPGKAVLGSEGITFDSEAFNRTIEARFGVFSKSRYADYSKRKSLNRLAKTAFLNAIIGGDVLVVLRYVKNQLTVQLIDGAHVCSPFYGNDYYASTLSNGNKIRHGIELSPSGEHVAYYVRTIESIEYVRVPAKNSDGLVTAFLVYGLEYRLDNHRGMPLIAATLETLKKLERYKEATVGSAEERQKIAYFLEHLEYSTGENPLSRQLVKAFDAEAKTEDFPEDVAGKQLADNIAATTNKQTYNLTPGATLKMLESKNELYFKDFYTVNIDLLCAAIDIPPDVAMSKYNSNFSASRMAAKDWEHGLYVTRSEFSEEYYGPVYHFFLEVESRRGKVELPGYLEARAAGNNMVVDAYRTARFVGAPVPHIDPLKEVNAERAKLGASGKDIPLTTVEAATEALNGGDSNQNMNQYAEELGMSKELGLISGNEMGVDDEEDNNEDL